MDELISIDAALDHYEATIAPLPETSIPLEEAQGRVLTRDATAQTDLPPFAQSAMDGYALRAPDTADATPDQPVALTLAGEIPAARLETVPHLGPGEAMRIFTGGHVPDGADAILRQEDAEVAGDTLRIAEPVSSGQDLRQAGEEIPAGTTLVEPGTRLTYRHRAALSIAGVDRVSARRAPRVRVLTTGDEIVPPGQALNPGEVYDANTPLVTGWLRQALGIDATAQPLPDTLDDTERALRTAFEEADLVLTTGGVSVGDFDWVIPAARNVGLDPVFWKVTQKPGKPLFFAHAESRQALLGLPGNPGSVFATLVTHGRRVLDLLEGASPPEPTFAMGKLAEPVRLDAQRERWVRCSHTCAPNGDVWLHVLPQQGSHMIARLGECTALARLPSGQTTLEHGHPVPCIPLESSPFGIDRDH